MRTTCTLFSALAILAAGAVSPASAKDDPSEFLHLLQKEGYADVAVDYLDQIKADPNAPKEIMELWELEMSRSKKGAAGQAYSDTEAKKLSDESKALLEQFIKSNPNRPEAIQEAAKWSEQKAMEGQYAVLRATYAGDGAEKAKLLANARTIFEEIRPRFVQAEKASAKLLASITRKKNERKWAEAWYMVGENRLTVAMVDFYLAQTQDAGAARTAALTKCIKEFDGIYQDYREIVLGWRAHFWNGRILQELGQLADAKAVFEEVAACDERNIEDLADNKVASRAKALKRTGLEDFFADVEQYYLQTLYQLSSKKDYKEYLEEAGTWRAAHKANSEKCYGYQALTFELAKNVLAIYGNAKDDVKKQWTGKALKLLGEMTRIPSPYTQDAIKLRRQLNPNISVEEGFEDAVIDGDAALEKKKWKEAAESYEKAVAAATAKTDKTRLATVENTIVACYHNMAMQLYQQRKTEEAKVMAQKALKKEFLSTKAAPGVAVFLLNLQYYDYLGAAEGTEAEKKAKGELLAKVAKTAKSILNIKEWAGKEEGDAARIILLRLALAQENMAEADRNLNEINPNSKEYPKALTVMGFAHWFKYRTAKKQIEADQANKVAVDKDKLAKRDEDRKLALEATDKAVKALDTPRPSDAPPPESLRESQLLLAEIYKEGEDFKKAAALYKPLVDEILKDSNKPLDETALRILDGAGQVFLQMGDVPNITSIATKLMEVGPDQGQINLMLMNIAKRLEIMRKKALAEGDAGDAAQGPDAPKKPLLDLQEKVMTNLSKRDKISPASMIWIVKTTNNLGTDDAKAAAAALIEKIIDKANDDPAFDEEIKKAKTALVSMGAIIQAERGQYDKANDLIDQLIQSVPRALEPRISKAKILTAWAAKDPSKYAKAINAWDNLRKKLEHISGADPKGGDATKVDPKYDVILNEADCFYRMAQKSKSKDEAKTGFDLLTPYLNLDPNIRTPNDAYQEISVRYFQVGGKLAEFLGVSRPVRPKAKRTLPSAAKP